MRVLVTGSSGLIGSEAVVYFDGLGWTVAASTTTCGASSSAPTATRAGTARGCEHAGRGSAHVELDIRDRDGRARPPAARARST